MANFDFIFEFDQPPWIWAAHYRSVGLQVIPCQGKLPLGTWKEFHNELVSDATFASWCAEGGRFRGNNIGVVLGKASGGKFMLDLDTYKGPAAMAWWSGCLAVHNNAMELETWEQVTGGGGRQLFFQCPEGWSTGNGSTSLNVDIRGQAGFAVLPPSLHASGRRYAWVEGRGPGQIDILVAPQWLIDELEALFGAHGKAAPAAEATASPEQDYDAFGNVQDGREKLMRDYVYRGVLELYRQAPIQPGEEASQVAATAAYEAYERAVKSRLPGDKREGLEREGRGPTVFASKWNATMRHWGSPRMVADASKPKPSRPDEKPGYDWQAQFDQTTAQAKVDPTLLYELLDVKQIKNLADPRWLVSGLIPEQSLGFVYGPPGCLKTFIGLDLALSFAAGRKQWLGRDVQHGGAVVYISSEGQGDLKFRIMAWEKYFGISADETPFRLIRQSINFMKGDDVGKLVATVNAVAEGTKQSIAAVFVDTVSRVLPGSDENLQKDMTIFVAACDAIRQRFGATVIGIHHTARAGNMRGSTVIPAAGDFIIEVKREPNAEVGMFTAVKVKAAQDGWDQHFKVVKVQITDIGGNTSLVLEATDATTAGRTLDERGWPSKAVCDEILAAIAQQWFKRQPWGASPRSARPALTAIMRRWKLKRETVKDMLATWEENGLIEEDVLDPKTKVKGYRKMTPD